MRTTNLQRPIANLRMSSAILGKMINIVMLVLFLTTSFLGVRAQEGKIVVLRAGDGSGLLTNSATPCFLNYFSTVDGFPAGVISLPTVANGANAALTISGVATSEGFLLRSSNKRYLSVAGYDAAVGTSSVSTTSSASVKRVIGIVDYAGNVNTTSQMTTGFSGTNIRSAIVSDDGTQLWASGATGGVFSISKGVVGAGTQIISAPTSTRVVNILGGQLYVSSAQTVFTIGTGLPSTAGQTAIILSGLPSVTGSPYAFVGFDINPGIPGMDVLYVADDRALASGGGLQRWDYNGTTWALSYTLTSGLSVGLRGLVGEIQSGNPVLYATTSAGSANSVVKITDAGASSVFSTLATAPPNAIFRGIAFAPLVDQTITFGPIPSKNFGDAPFALTATASSGLPVTYSSSNTAVATVNGSSVTIVGAGTTTITASQSGSSNYSAATDVPQTLTVNKVDQVITFNSLVLKNYGDAPFALGATASSGLSVSYSSDNINVASVSGNTVTIVGAGTTTITASQAGDGNYNAATDVPQALTVNKATQTVTFNSLPSKNFGDAPFALVATASSGLTVSYSSSNTSVATVTGNTVTIVGGGSTTITASQIGDANYSAATDVPQILTVNKATQTVTFNSLPSKNFGDAPFALVATASSGLTVSYSSSNTSVATVSGSTVTIVGAGTTTITASQAGDGNYSAATNVPQALTVNKANQTITFNSLGTRNYGDPPSTVSAITSSGLPVSYFSSNSAVAYVNGNTLVIAGAGTTTITASQSGNSNYSAAVDVPQALTVNKANQTITFNPLPSKNYGDAPFGLSALASSGLQLSFSSSNTNVATVNGSVVTIVGVGTTTITASQSGNVNYNAASDVPQSLTVNKANQTISFGAGSIDLTFNPTDGGFGAGNGANSTVQAVVPQPDGKVLIGGSFNSYGTAQRSGIARVNADGSLDTSFDPGIGINSGTLVKTIALQSDGKILIGGSFTSYNGTGRNFMARLNSDGTLDTNFASPLSSNGLSVNVNSIVVQSDGKILVGGRSTFIQNGWNSVLLMRLNPDGSSDASFNPGNAVSSYSGNTSPYSVINSIVVQPDGKLLIGGVFYTYYTFSYSCGFLGQSTCTSVVSYYSYVRRLNADGSADPNFLNPSNSSSVAINTMALQADGKIVIGGIFDNYNTTTRSNIARLNSDGSLDTGFDPGSGTNSQVSASCIQPDGKILIGGIFSSYNGNARSYMARVNADGSFDSGFDSGSGTTGFVSTIVLGADGKIFAGGGFFKGIAHLNSDGSFDPNFNQATGANSQVWPISVQPDGKIVIGGAFTTYNGVARNRIARLNVDGSLDTSFDSGSGASGTVISILRHLDGNLLIGGAFTAFNGVSRKGIARLNSAGNLDLSFDPGSGTNSGVFSLALQADAKILIGGQFSTYNGTSRNGIARLNLDGSLDPSFNLGSGTNSNSIVYSITFQPDGKILIGGNFTTYNGVARQGIARLNSDGSLDTSFNPGSGTNSGSIVLASARQPDGKILIGGNFSSYNGVARQGIARLNSDGSIDTGFDQGSGANSGGLVFSITLQADGKILMGGNFMSYNGVARQGIARLNSDGTLDVSFAPGSGGAPINSIALQSDGNVLIGGSFTSYNGTGRNRIARINGSLPIKTYGDAPFALLGTSTSGLAVTYSSNNTSVATISGSTLTVVGAGTAVISADQSGNAIYNAAPSSPQMFTVNKATQAIAFSALPSKNYGDAPFTLAATASSGLPITYISSNTSVATVNGSTVTLVGAGTTTFTASQPGNGNYNVAVDVPQALTVNKGNQTIAFTPLTSKNYGEGPFTLGAIASSNLAVSYSSSNTNVATVSGSTVTIVGAGTTTITASQAGNSNFDAANDVPQTLTVNKANQTITFNALAAKNFGDAPFPLNVGISSNLPVSFSSSNTNVATISGSTVTIVGTGGTTITASQPGNSNYNAATDVQQPLTINKANQTIIFGPLVSKNYGDVPFTLSGTASSGLVITYTSSNANVATVNGNTVTIVGAGTSTITALQPGSNNYNGAPAVPQTFTVNKASQTITFSPLVSKNYGDAPFGLGATTNSGLAVSYTSSNSSVATISGSTVTIVGAGTTTITASQTGNGNYNAANDVQQTLTADKANQTIKFNSLVSKNYGDSPFSLLATASSGSPVSYSSSNTNVATISGNTLTIVGAGTTIITATQSGNDNYNAATAVPQTLTVNKANQTITFNALSTQNYGDDPFTLSAAASSGLGVLYSSSNTGVATINGNTVTIVGVGATTITASQTGDGNYTAAIDVPQTLTVSKGNQVITFNALSTQNYGDDPFTLSASASSGLGVLYSSSNTGVATISGSTVTIVGVGTTTITASQTGDGNYTAAIDVPQVFTVNKANQTITFVSLPSKSYGDAPFTLGAAASSSLAVSYSSSNTSVATITDNTVTIVGAGTTTITASQSGDGSYNSAIDASQTLTVNKGEQTITFNSLASRNYGDAPFALSATASSGLATSYSSSNTSVATVNGTNVIIVGAGTTTITASQAGDGNYTAAIDVPQVLTVNKANQTITFNSLPSRNYGDAPFALSATASSGLATSYSSSNTSVATVNGTNVTIVGAGTTTITASQAGDGNYNAAIDVPQTLTVNKGEQTITFNSLPSRNYGDAPFALSATASSGFAVSYSSSNTSVATINGNMVTIVGIGTTTITASQTGNGSYNAATEVPQTLTVNKGNQTITFNSLPSKNYGDGPFSLGATSSSGLSVSYTSNNSNVATVIGATVTIVGAGTVTITASQAGNDNYNAAADVLRMLTVNKANQTITVAGIAAKALGDPAFNVSATASSGLAVTFATTSDKITIAGSTVTLIKAGRAIISAIQSGNSSFNAAPSVDQSFCINPPKPTITFSGKNTASVTLTSSNTSGNQWFVNDTAIPSATDATLVLTQPGIYKVQTAVDDCHSLFSDNTTIIVTGEISDPFESIKLYPNPVQNEVEITGIKEINESTVSDAMGRTFTIELKKDGEIYRGDVRSLANGLYILQIREGNNWHQLKLIKN